MDTAVAIVGAGPYGLATAARLRASGVAPLVFGRVMGAWERMPEGMKLRSFRESTNIGDSGLGLSIDAFEHSRGRPIPSPVPVEDFVAYGRWFQAEAVPDVDPTLVREVLRTQRGFTLTLSNGAEVSARQVVVAAGIEFFARIPATLASADADAVSHSSAHADFRKFAGRRLLIVGGGQSALESAALAHEAGADVELVSRRALRFLRGERVHNSSGVFRALLYPSWGVGPPGLNWVMGRPTAYRLFPNGTATTLAARAIRPAGAAWLRPRLEPITLTVGASAAGIDIEGGEVRVRLDNGEERRVDHVVAATGYSVDVARYPFLDAQLVQGIARTNGFPLLTRSYESSVPGLYFAGAPAAASMGPGMRFVSHSGMAASALARRIRRR